MFSGGRGIDKRNYTMIESTKPFYTKRKIVLNDEKDKNKITSTENSNSKKNEEKNDKKVMSEKKLPHILSDKKTKNKEPVKKIDNNKNQTASTAPQINFKKEDEIKNQTIKPNSKVTPTTPPPEDKKKEEKQNNQIPVPLKKEEKQKNQKANNRNK